MRRAGPNVLLQVLDRGEDPRHSEHQIDPKSAPGQVRWVTLGEDRDPFLIKDQRSFPQR